MATVLHPLDPLPSTVPPERAATAVSPNVSLTSNVSASARASTKFAHTLSGPVTKRKNRVGAIGFFTGSNPSTSPTPETGQRSGPVTASVDNQDTQLDSQLKDLMGLGRGDEGWVVSVTKDNSRLFRSKKVSVARLSDPVSPSTVAGRGR